MKRILTTITVSLMLLPIWAQPVPNGGFEDWDSSHYTIDNPEIIPLHWNKYQFNTPCYPTNFHADPSLSSHSGCCSAVMEAATCVEDAGGFRLDLGFIHSGDPTLYPPHDWSVEYAGRPTLLNFYYKFHPEGGDSAYVKIILFNYDSITPGLSSPERTDTVAFSSGYMVGEVTDFTPFSLPIQYLSADTPAFMGIFFSTSKTLSENPLGDTPYEYAYPGTTLWIDDVDVSQGTIGVAELAQHEPSIAYPNPGHDLIRFTMPQGSSVFHASVFDARGVLVIKAQRVPSGSGLDVGGLAQGLYTIVLTTTAGKSMHVKWIKE